MNFWICSLRSITNGSLILILLPKCFTDQNIEEGDSNEETTKNSKFKYKQNEVNLLSRWTYSWILPLLWHGYKTPIDVEVLEKVTEQEKSKIQAEKLKDIIEKGNDDKNYNVDKLFRACMKMNWYVIFLGGFYRLAADICSLASALSIKWIVRSIDFEKNKTENVVDEEENLKTIQDFWTSPYVIVFAILAFGILQGLFSQARLSTSEHSIYLNLMNSQ